MIRDYGSFSGTTYGEHIACIPYLMGWYQFWTWNFIAHIPINMCYIRLTKMKIKSMDFVNYNSYTENLFSAKMEVLYESGNNLLPLTWHFNEEFYNLNQIISKIKIFVYKFVNMKLESPWLHW